VIDCCQKQQSKQLLPSDIAQQMLLYELSECKLSKPVTYMDGGNASRISNLALKAAGDGVQIL